MGEIKELTEIQYDILTAMSRDWCYGFRHFDNLKLTRKELSKEFKILKEAGLVYFSNGLMTDEGEVAGSGYGIDKENEVDRLVEEWEEKNLPTYEEAIKEAL